MRKSLRPILAGLCGLLAILAVRGVASTEATTTLWRPAPTPRTAEQETAIEQITNPQAYRPIPADSASARAQILNPRSFQRRMTAEDQARFDLMLNPPQLTPTVSLPGASE